MSLAASLEKEGGGTQTAANAATGGGGEECAPSSPSSPRWAIIFEIWRDEPVYHRLATPLETRCGRKIGPGKPMLPFKHAVKFGRPCKGCFPE